MQEAGLPQAGRVMTGRNVHLSIDVATMADVENPHLLGHVVDSVEHPVFPDANPPAFPQFSAQAFGPHRARVFCQR